MQTFDELMQTDWKAYGFGRDPRCANCMMHCGYEGSAIADAMSHPKALAEMAWRSVRPGTGLRSPEEVASR